MQNKQKDNCERCVKHKTIDDKPQEQPEVKLLGSRVLPTYIMYDGQGKYNRKLNQGFKLYVMKDHENLKVTIPIEWKTETKEETPRLQQNYDKLPTIFHRRKVEDVIPMKPLITQEHQRRYGKFSIRYNQKSDVFFSRDRGDYTPSSDKYGQFYLSQEPRPKVSLDEFKLDDFKQSYKIFDVEKPVLKYHSLKSQIFQK
ncbi:hypothetical protein pb186bvf_010095 [Paramecium bursaria]